MKFSCSFSSDLIAQTYQSSTQSGVTPIAYHYRKPILVSDVEGLKSQIVTDKSGEIVEREPKAVAKGIIKILDKAVLIFTKYRECY